MSHIVTTCSSCNSKLKARPDLAGRTVHCPKCGSRVKVPVPEEDATEDPPTTIFVPPATEEQKENARKLGISFPENIDTKDMGTRTQQALSQQDEQRHQGLDELQNQESKVRKELKQESIAKLDKDDLRLSMATPAQMVEALVARNLGAILVTFDPDVDPNDLTGIQLNVSTEANEETVKAVLEALVVKTNRN